MLRLFNFSLAPFSPTRWRSAFLSAFLGLFVSLPAFAQNIGAAVPDQIHMLSGPSPVHRMMDGFHDMLLVIIGLIVLLVTGLLAWVVIRYNAKANPKPATFTHNVKLEILWTAIPVLILVIIAVPSFRLLYYSDKNPDAVFTIKVTGYQWYWGYEYPDYGDFKFSSYLLNDEDLANPQRMAEVSQDWLIKTQKPLRLLETDNRVVIPVGVPVRIQTTAADVLHSWAMPALGVKKDAVPGRLNETWIQADEPGVYYGQCSELCGTGHGFMPITLEAVPQADFNAWIEKAKVKFAAAGQTTIHLAASR